MWTHLHRNNSVVYFSISLKFCKWFDRDMRYTISIQDERVKGQGRSMIKKWFDHMTCDTLLAFKMKGSKVKVAA